jgi:hypothetical protein
MVIDSPSQAIEMVQTRHSIADGNPNSHAQRGKSTPVTHSHPFDKKKKRKRKKKKKKRRLFYRNSHSIIGVYSANLMGLKFFHTSTSSGER